MDRQDNKQARRKVLDELTEYMKRERIFCSLELDYLLTAAIRSRIAAITDIDDLEKIDNYVITKIKEDIIPYNYLRSVYSNALRKRGVSDATIKSLKPIALEEIARVFCEITCDKPYSVKDLLKMI